MKQFITILLLALMAGNIQAKIWRVNNTPEVDAVFKTAQAAHDSSIVNAGDTLYFEGSPDSYGSLTMVKKLVLIGPGYFLGENKGHQANLSSAKLSSILLQKEVGQAASPGKSAIAASTSAGSSIIGLEIISQFIIYTPIQNIKRCKIYSLNLEYGSTISPYSQLNYTANGNNTVVIQNFISHLYIGDNDNIVVSNNIFDNGQVYNNSSSNNVTCMNNTFTYSDNCIALYNATIRNNILLGNTGYAIVNNSINSNNIASKADGFPTGNNNQNSRAAVDVIVGSGSTDGFYKLIATGYGKGAGYDGADCGAFGGATPYILSGIPAIPSIYELIMPATGTQTNGIKVTIKAKTNQ